MSTDQFLCLYEANVSRDTTKCKSAFRRHVWTAVTINGTQSGYPGYKNGLIVEVAHGVVLTNEQTGVGPYCLL